jgi:hypothetical protein
MPDAYFADTEASKVLSPLVTFVNHIVEQNHSQNLQKYLNNLRNLYIAGA